MRNKFVVFLLTFSIICAFTLLTTADDEKNNTKPVDEPSNEPQVIYIQYSTPEEAEEAKRRILAEYGAFEPKAVISEDVSPFISISTETEKADTTEKVKDEVKSEPVQEKREN